MILAGVLSASLASCVVKNSNDPDSTGTEPYYHYTSGEGGNQGTINPPTSDPSTLNYEERNETVYVITDKTTLKLSTDITQSITLGLTTELNRTGWTNHWSRVDYNGTTYYVASSALTTDDLKEKTFTSCNKTMFAVGKVNVRKYPSAEDTISTILTSVDLDAEIKVIAESSVSKWSKVEVKKDSKTITGFIKSEFLSTTKATPEEKDYIDNFTLLETPVKMYVNTSTANLRKHPYVDDKRGPLMDGVGDGLPLGTEVNVIAKGTVEGHAWCMIEWKPAGSAAQKGYISQSCLSLTPAGVKATLADMLKAYPDLVKFDTPMTLYTTGSVFGRSRPSFAKTSQDKDENVIISLDKKATQVKAVAYGKLDTIDTDGSSKFEMTWVLVENENVGYYFVSYNYLTPNSDGSPAQIPVSLDQLLEAYGFTTLNLNIRTSRVIKGYSTPDTSSNAKDIPENTSLKVVAQGQTGDGFIKNKWYIVEYDGALYFIANDSANFDIV